MVSFNKFFTSVYLAVVYATVASAAPRPSPVAPPSTHRVHELGKRGLKLVAFNPPSAFETFGTGIEHPTSDSFTESTLEESAVAFIQDRLNIDTSDIAYRTGYTEDETSHAYVQQKHDGIAFSNSVANIAFKNNKVVAFGSSFVKPEQIAKSTPSVSVEAAIATAEEALDGKFNDVEAKLEYVVLEDGSAILAHVVQIQNDEAETFYAAYVDAHSGELTSVVDFVAEATYYVLPVTKEYPTEGFETLVDPQILAASPLGWHSDGVTNTTDTSGNNVVSYKSALTSTTPQSAPDLVFNYPPDLTVAPTTVGNVHLGRVNTFYIVNAVHDTWYLYGFTEASYNFQNANFGKGGNGNDRVRVSTQDSGGTNNANFATPPDGQPGQMRMYLWTRTTPQRDGDLENDIVIHEFTHGLSNRLTGGGTGSCLQTTESRGLGEGWSDAMADWFQQDENLEDFILGGWVLGGGTNNIRRYPYSPSSTVNPLRYRDVAGTTLVHNIGEVWANLLHNVHIGLVDAHGFDPTASSNPDSTAGNAVFLHLFLDALKLQPCNPTFVTARAAWIQADANRYGGANRCLLWGVFASRGLGSGAVSGNYTENSAVPDDCVAE
ncbi:Fungalysin metallopeptidase-domain-containing protein [Pterulicium gracile]|uniref:Extracellular metalloproteinase n=1 Tax=Pterulicium gracile TaxID=1884261 RepID=A0A5C3QQG3_9AGAR|nr:Fungalysin metallopeptidase-domain-containing protein [Pterula gracilis]